MRSIAAAILIIVFAFGSIFSEGRGEIIVSAENFRNEEGSARFSLFRGKKGFPSKYEHAYMNASAVITDNKARAVFEGIEPGEYAVSVLHDKNDNYKLDTNFLGIPREGVGVSNNAKGRFGPPSFEDAAFEVEAGTNAIEIGIFYIGRE